MVEGARLELTGYETETKNEDGVIENFFVVKRFFCLQAFKMIPNRIACTKGVLIKNML